jgi:sugar lactone lactonase YvrE
VPREVAGGIRFANGVALSPDGKLLYVAETPAGRILAFDIAADGALTGRRVFVQLSDVLATSHPLYSPDGIRTDGRGNLFVALYNGGGHRRDRAGRQADCAA